MAREEEFLAILQDIRWLEKNCTPDEMTTVANLYIKLRKNCPHREVTELAHQFYKCRVCGTEEDTAFFPAGTKVLEK